MMRRPRETEQVMWHRHRSDQRLGFISLSHSQHIFRVLKLGSREVTFFKVHKLGSGEVK
jgi:hypothetical protein